METDNPFEKVLDRLREKGWYQGYYYPKDKEGASLTGPYCIKGAADCVWAIDAIEKSTLPKIIAEQYGTPADRGHEPIAWFNDHPDTTFSDVERVLEKAAVQWEEERVMRE